MQKWKIACMLLVLGVVSEVKAQESYDQRVKDYIEHYKDWAIEEQRRSGVPAAVTLAQGIHETSAGSSELALNANNHFGIKCKKEWNGETYAYTDDAPDECFRKYPSAFQSYKDHSDYLAGSQRYASLFKLSAKDYSGWCVGLKRCGYATNPKYSQILIKLIEQYSLQQYTNAALSDDYNPVKAAAQQEQKASGVIQQKQTASEEGARPLMPDMSAKQTSTFPQSKASKRSGMSVSYGATPQTVKKNEDDEYVPADDPQNPEYGKLVKVAGLKAFYAKKGTVLLEDAFRFNIRYSKLLEINELPDLPLHGDMYIFLEKKNPKGIHETHVVEPGETLSTIAQSEAMQLRYLKYYNHIGANEEPVAGAFLQLQHYSDDKPATVVKDVAPAEAEPGAFAGSHPGAIPQGATRMRSGYISKKEIRAAEKADIALAKAKETKVPEDKVTEEEPKEEKRATETIDEPKKDAPEMASEEAEEVVKPPEKSENVAIDTTVPESEPAVATIASPAEGSSESDTTQASVAADTTAPAVVVKNEEIEYEMVQPEPVIENNKKEVVSTVTANEQPKEELRQADTIESVAPVAATIAPIVKETETIKAPEKVSLPVEEPKDEYAKLKARLDKVVYASANTATETEEPNKTEDVKKPEDPKKDVAAPSPVDKKDPSRFYTVKKGDTAFGIAKKNNITMRQLMDWNKLDFQTIKVGQQLRIK